MSQPASHITDTRRAIGELTDAFERVVAKLGEYAALGGSDAVLPFWQTTDDEGNVAPRTLDITHQQYIDALASLQAFRDLANSGHATNLYRIKN